jgi:serine/threonine protein kinase
MHSHVLPSGSVIDIYRIERLLSSGPLGLTYFATDTQFGAKVTVREFLPIAYAVRNDQGRIAPLFDDAAEMAAAVHRFIEESRAFGAIHHPNVLRVVRLFEANGSAYLVTEYEPGLTLAAWVEAHGKPKPATVANWLAILADALEALHAGRVIHCGVQPGRIRIRGDSSPVLLDFGAGHHAGNDPFRAAPLVVSPGFAPLEQYWSKGPRGPWTDLYALAAVGYWLISGERPVEAPARAAGVAMTRLAEHPHRGEFEPALLAAIDAALAMEPGARPQRAIEWRRQFSANLDTITGNFSVTPAPVIAAPAVWPPSQDRLDAIRADLAASLGPIATLIVKQASARFTNWRAFCQAIADDIPDAQVRSAFLNRFAEPELAGVATAPQSAAVFPAQMLTAMEAELARHIGAIARIVVKRSAARARGKKDFYTLLASEITDPARAHNFMTWAESKFGRD